MVILIIFAPKKPNQTGFVVLFYLYVFFVKHKKLTVMCLFCFCLRHGKADVAQTTAELNTIDNRIVNSIEGLGGGGGWHSSIILLVLI